MKTTMKKDLFVAMKEKKTILKGVLQLILANIQNDEIKLKRELTKEEEISVIKKELKQTEDTLAQLNSSKVVREDSIKETMEKIDIIKSYLPKFLTEDEILDILVKSGATKGMKMGQLMPMIMKEHKSEVDGKMVKSVIEKNFL